MRDRSLLRFPSLGPIGNTAQLGWGWGVGSPESARRIISARLQAGAAARRFRAKPRACSTVTLRVAEAAARPSDYHIAANRRGPQKQARTGAIKGRDRPRFGGVAGGFVPPARLSRRSDVRAGGGSPLPYFPGSGPVPSSPKGAGRLRKAEGASPGPETTSPARSCPRGPAAVSPAGPAPVAIAASMSQGAATTKMAALRPCRHNNEPEGRRRGGGRGPEGGGQWPPFEALLT